MATIAISVANREMHWEVDEATGILLLQSLVQALGPAGDGA